MKIFRSAHFISTVFLSLCLGVALFSAAHYAITRTENQKPYAKHTVNWSADAASNNYSKAVIEMMAYCRGSRKFTKNDVQWAFSLNSSGFGRKYDCLFKPDSHVENFEMSNPDGSVYFIGMMKAYLQVKKHDGINIPSSSKQYQPFIPEKLPCKFDGPVIHLEGTLGAKGISITWTTHNFPQDNCRVLFKIIEPATKDAPLLCSLSGT